MRGSCLSGFFVGLFFLLAFLLQYESRFLRSGTLFGHGLGVFTQFLFLCGKFGQAACGGIALIATSCNAFGGIGDFSRQ